MDTFLLSVGFGVITASILALAGVGFTLQFGATNVLNLAFGDVMTLAAFICYLTIRAGGNLWAGLAAGALSGALGSYLLNRGIYTPFARRGTRLFAMIIVSLSMSLIIQNSLQAIFGASFFSFPLPPSSVHHVGPMIFTGQQFVIIGIAIVAMVGIEMLLHLTKLGRAMRATAADAPLARSCGVATDRVIDLAWLLSGLLCGLAGVALVLNVASFTSTTGQTFLVPIIAVAVLGGVGSPRGAMIGALVIGLVTELSAAYISPSYKEVFAFIVLIVVLLLRPQGIFSEVASQKEVAA